MADTTTFPFRTIVRITDQIGASMFQGSGVLISPDEVLTAAHVVWSTGVGVATSLSVQPGYDSGSEPYGSIDGAVTHYNPINDTNDLIQFTDTPSDYALVHLARPLSLGAMGLGAPFASGTVFASGYPANRAGAQVDVAEPVSAFAPGVLTGAALGQGSSGGPLWTVDPAGNPAVVGLASSLDAAGNGYYMQMTAQARAQILTWVAQDDAFAPVVNFSDTRTGATGTQALQPTDGNPSTLDWQYIWSSPDTVALSTGAPNAFLHGGAGDDAIQATAGHNVLDGGTGSNFLIGGSGADTFFTDARGSQVVWNTLSNFHAGDAATLWGFVPGVSSYYWETSPAGAPGATGATLRADIVGGAGRDGSGIDASITFAGLSVAQAQQLVVSTGTQAAGTYLFLSNPGV